MTFLNHCSSNSTQWTRECRWTFLSENEDDIIRAILVPSETELWCWNLISINVIKMRESTVKKKKKNKAEKDVYLWFLWSTKCSNRTKKYVRTTSKDWFEIHPRTRTTHKPNWIHPAQQVHIQIITACHFSNASAHISDNKKLLETRLLLAKILFYEIRLSQYVGHVLKDTISSCLDTLWFANPSSCLDTKIPTFYSSQKQRNIRLKCTKKCKTKMHYLEGRGLTCEIYS